MEHDEVSCFFIQKRPWRVIKVTRPWSTDQTFVSVRICLVVWAKKAARTTHFVVGLIVLLDRPPFASDYEKAGPTILNHSHSARRQPVCPRPLDTISEAGPGLPSSSFVFPCRVETRNQAQSEASESDLSAVAVTKPREAGAYDQFTGISETFLRYLAMPQRPKP